LFGTVWHGTAVSDDALTSCIQELRRALEDDSKQPRFIETRHRRGYRFVARLYEATPDDSANGTRYGTRHREQEIRFCTASDGVSLAYSTVGSGPYIVRVLGHFTHLEAEWEWPDLRRFWEHLAERHTVVRYDGRGIGLSDRYAGEFTEETRQGDLQAVLAAIGAEKAVLLGISEGGWTAAAYAVQHPEQITHLVLYGAYCRGAQARPGYDREEDQALVTLIRKGWGRDTPAFRQVITSQFFRSDADPKLIAQFNELQRLSADPDTAARYHESCHKRGDGRDLFRKLRIPVLIIHSRDDLAVSADEGRLLASIIPGSQLVLLPSGAHYFPTDTDVVTKAAGAITRFLHGPESLPE
jgi:pimeloyl-ACP methyl ester carboxylesterase